MKINRSRKIGFTLLEMLVVLVIIGLLASIAMVNYQAFVLKSNRAGDALPYLNHIMQAQERYAAEQGSYTEDLTALGFDGAPISPGGHYKIEAVACDGSIVRCVNLRALAQGNQSKDSNDNDLDKDGKYGDISYNSRGEKTGLD